MDIGKKLRDARNAAGLTQESAAESLGVSRQSVSNWETGKTYPDIVSVIRMSGLYSVSLDCLLKEEKTVSNNLNYLNYLEESTNVVKSRRRLGKLVLVASYLVIWAVSVAFFWLAVSGSDAGAYAVLVIWGAIPLTTFVISLLIGANGYWGRKKWWAVPILALMYTLIPFLTFTLANAASMGISAGDIAVHLDDLNTLPIGAAVSAAGSVAVAAGGAGAFRLQPLHQRGLLHAAEDGPHRLRHQQRRQLRSRLPRPLCGRPGPHPGLRRDDQPHLRHHP